MLPNHPSHDLQNVQGMLGQARNKTSVTRFGTDEQQNVGLGE